MTIAISSNVAADGSQDDSHTSELEQLSRLMITEPYLLSEQQQVDRCEYERRVLGDTIRKFRMDRNLTQEELGLRSLTDRSFIGRLEQGRSFPTMAKLLDICSVLNISPGQLLDDAFPELVSEDIS